MQRIINGASYRLAVRFPSYVEAVIKGNAIRAYWYRDIKNFGDLFTPMLLRHFGFTPIHTYPVNAEVIGVGSILEHADESFSGTVLGSGFIFEHSRMELPHARVLSVRGVLTRERLGVRHRSALLGDPGLLAPLLLPAQPPKRYVVGIVPQHVNLNPSYLPAITAKHRQSIRVIDVMNDPRTVVEAMAECEHILSASLHGLVVADALGIPSGWIAEKSLLGGRFKFDDYYSSLGLQNLNPVRLQGDETLSQLVGLTTVRSAVAVTELQGTIHNLFDGLHKN